MSPSVVDDDDAGDLSIDLVARYTRNEGDILNCMTAKFTSVTHSLRNLSSPGRAGDRGMGIRMIGSRFVIGRN